MLWLLSRFKVRNNPAEMPPERVLLPPQLCSDCGQWSMISSPFVSPTQSKQFETCELLQPQNFTLVPLSEPPPPSGALRGTGSVYGNCGNGEISSTIYWSSVHSRILHKHFKYQASTTSIFLALPSPTQSNQQEIRLGVTEAAGGLSGVTRL